MIPMLPMSGTIQSVTVSDGGRGPVRAVHALFPTSEGAISLSLPAERVTNPENVPLRPGTSVELGLVVQGDES